MAICSIPRLLKTGGRQRSHGQHSSTRLCCCGVLISTGHATQIVIYTGENIDRSTSEAALARLCETAPITRLVRKIESAAVPSWGD